VEKAAAVSRELFSESLLLFVVERQYATWNGASAWPGPLPAYAAYAGKAGRPARREPPPGYRGGGGAPGEGVLRGHLREGDKKRNEME
jgi:hypothetical protein